MTPERVPRAGLLTWLASGLGTDERARVRGTLQRGVT